MRLTVFFMVLGILSTSAKTYSQQSGFTFDYKSTSIKQILKELEESSKFDFVYSNDDFDVNQKVDIKITNGSIEEMLNNLLKDTGMGYNIVDKVIILAPKDMNNFSRVGSQQKIKLSGKVKDTTGQPLPGVTVVVKGTTNGTITNFDGVYTLPEVPSDGTIQFSFVGMKMQEIPVGGKTSIDVVMEEDAIGIEEVVAVGYGTVKKKDLTGGLSVIGEEKLKMGSNNNLMDRLVGQVAGLNITTTNAAPGQDQRLLIRGENSISANNEPLIVLDGIPYSGSLVDLNPNIIENLSILKDASAVAIYGARGSNGVILIQTKRGIEGKPQVTYKGQLGFAEPMQRIQVMGPNEYIRLKQDIGRLKLGYTGDQLDPIAGNIISISERDNYAKGIVHDWQDYVFQTGFTMDHQVSISGGTASTKYMAAIAYLDQEGVVYNSNLARTNITVNVDQVFNKWLTIGVGTRFIQKETGGITPNIEHAIKQSPYGKYKDDSGYYVAEPMEYSLIKNPMINVNADQDNTNRNFFLNAYAKVLFPVEGLSYRTNYGYNYRSSFVGTYYGRDTFEGREQGGLIGGKASISNNHYTDYTWENIIRYEREIDDHRFDATGLFSIQENKSVSSSQSGEGFVTDDTSYYMMGTAERNQNISSRLSETSMLSYMLRLNYAYKGKYMATLTGRSDGSSVFGENNKYAFFPSAALAWHIAEESFIKDNIGWMDMLKLRVSYGANGNQAITAYRTLDRLYSNVKYIWGDGSTAVNTAFLANDGIGNPNLKWETTYSFNIGLDFQLFKGRLGGTIETYLSNTHDLLMTRTVPIMNGYSKIWDNVGQTRNKGIELTFKSVNIDNGNFQWNTDLIFSLNRDRIIDLRGDKIDDITNKWFIGKPLRVYYDYNMIDIWQQGDEYFGTDNNGNEREIQTGANPGSAKLEDVDGNRYINSDDKKVIGSKMPDFTMSIGNRFNYKNFYLSFLLNGVFGVWRENNLDNIGSWTFGVTNYVHGAKYWTPERPNADIVSPGYTNTFGHGYYKKVSYCQIKNITFGYKLNPNIARKLGVGAIDINMSVNNMHAFSNIRQVLNYDNSWMASYPTARSYMLGLNLTF